MSPVPFRDRPARVGLLAYALDRPLSGVGRVALELGWALQNQAECQIVYLTTYRRGPFHDAGEPCWFLPGCGMLPGLMALGSPMIALAARRLQLDLVHDPSGVSPFLLGRWAGGFKRVVTIHDAIAFRHPEGYPWLNNFLHRSYVPATLGHVDAVITVSQHARADLLRFLPATAGRIHVAPDGVSERFAPVPQAVAQQVASRYGCDGPFILSLGAQQARKNLPRLLEAFARLHHQLPAYWLAIAGPSLWAHEDLGDVVRRLGLGDAVRLLGYVPEEELPALYSAASLFVFPSLYEGFGLPVLEAMACGTPVVCSSASSLPEVAGDAALLVDPASVQDMAAAMAHVLTDPDLRAGMRAGGLARARQFTWQRTARETVAVYRSVLLPQ
ncbi:MAG: glycosyltransferase family 4 protein [Chloroflexi bacterium]|nr:glycosyltransferase family 4 protein [Chloroflexota bacterium]